MPYANIVFVKFRLELLNDYRFTDCLNDSQKLLFWGLLVLAGATKNEIPNDPNYIKRQLNLESTCDHIEQNIRHIAGVFPKVITTNGVISWEDFESIHNYTIGNSKGIPKENPCLETGISQKKNKKKKKNKKDIYSQVKLQEILDDFNSVANKNYKLTHKNRELIESRLREGFTVDDFKRVHRVKAEEWLNDSTMSLYLRPITLYSNKFESYLNQPKKKKVFR